MAKVEYDKQAKVQGLKRQADSGEPMKPPEAEPEAKSDILAPDLDRLFKPLAEHEKPWLTTQPPDQEWLLSLNGASEATENKDGTATNNGVLPLGRVGMITAEGGAGKTYAVAQLALAVATGLPWLGRFGVSSPGRVLLCVGEEDEGEIWRRLRRAAAALGLFDPSESESKRVAELRELAMQRLYVLPLAGYQVEMIDAEGNATPFFEDLRKRLGEDMKADPWRLLVFDPLSRFGGPEMEIDNHAATATVEVFESLTHLPDRPTVLLTHHTNKAARAAKDAHATAARGSSALSDGVRWQAHLEPLRGHDDEIVLPDLVKLTQTKNNVGRWFGEVWLERDKDSGVLRETRQTALDEYRLKVEANAEIAKAKKNARTEEARALARRTRPDLNISGNGRNGRKRSKPPEAEIPPLPPNA